MEEKTNLNKNLTLFSVTRRFAKTLYLFQKFNSMATLSNIIRTTYRILSLNLWHLLFKILKRCFVVILGMFL